MPESQSLLDRLHYENRKTYSHREGNVEYLDGSGLARPARLPRAQWAIAALIVAVALVVGGVFLNNMVFSKWREAANAEQDIANNLARESSLETLPAMADLINLSDEDILATFAAAGYQIYDASALYDSSGMTLVKVPSDMTVDDAAALYVKGVNALSAVEATRLLNGSWLFACDRVGITSMVTRYADFTTADPQIAVQNALAKEGFDPAGITESGVDDSGNTYSLGSLDAAGTPCSWKISALELTDMYSISGLPESACYVGIRVTAV